jgi:predicted MFS family arabinose efflux permease
VGVHGSTMRSTRGSVPRVLRLPGVSSALSSRRQQRIIAAYITNRLGSWMGLVALSLAVFDHTHSALAVSALLFAWQALPAFLVPPLVARVEASARRSELSALYFFEAAATAAIAILLGHFWLPGILVLALLDGTAALAANSLLRAALARVAREESLKLGGAGRDEEARETDAQRAEREANAALNVAFSLSFVGGPVLGGLVTAGLGAAATLYVDVATFAVCGALLLDLRPHVEEAGEASVRARLQAAWTHIVSGPTLRGLLLTEFVALSFIQAAAPIEVAFAKATLHAGDRGYGLMVTAWGAGTVLASLIFARSVRKPLAVLLSAGIFALGASFVGMALAPTLALACVGSLVGGIGNALEWPSLMTLVQELTPQKLHGRLMGAVESMGALCLAIGLPLGGLLVAATSARVAFAVVGAGTLASTAAFVRLTRRERGVSAAAADGPERTPSPAITAPAPADPEPFPHTEPAHAEDARDAAA